MPRNEHLGRDVQNAKRREIETTAELLQDQELKSVAFQRATSRALRVLAQSSICGLGFERATVVTKWACEFFASVGRFVEVGASHTQSVS